MFPETARLLKKFAAESPDPEYVFVNENGKPLLNFAGEKKNDNIKSLWFKLLHKKGLEDLKDKRFKDLRKTLATEVGRIANSDVARVAMAQKTGGELKRYMQEDYAKLTAALKIWHTELTAAKVFDSLKEETDGMTKK